VGQSNKDGVDRKQGYFDTSKDASGRKNKTIDAPSGTSRCMCSSFMLCLSVVRPNAN
jgi:hypothetical protein